MDQVMLRYGARDDASLLLQYGFVMGGATAEANPHGPLPAAEPAVVPAAAAASEQVSDAAAAVQAATDAAIAADAAAKAATDADTAARAAKKPSKP